MQRVLVIDDDERLRELLSEYLSARGYEVLTASDGPGGLERLRGGAIELVVLDDSRCIELMAGFMRERPDLWNEDIGE